RRFFYVPECLNKETAIPADTGILLIIKVNYVVCVFNDRGSVGSNKELVLPYTDYQRTSLTCSYQVVSIVLLHDNDGVGSYHFVECRTHRIFQAVFTLFLDLLNKVRQHLSTCVRMKHITSLDKFRLDGIVVLDDSIVD